MTQEPDVTRITGAEAAGTAAAARQIGPWRILDVLGEGGMGVVYLAERSDGAFDRQVALKLLRPGLDSGSFEARFLQERRTLAALEHPYIARLLDAGRAADGLPYFAMERVEGQPIDAWCQSHGLDVDARIALFLQVCEAVQYAHGRLIVHRDIKPSNVLVDTEGRVRLLDFGIAKLLDETGEGALTRASERLLTPQYAAPEQLLGHPVGVGADVYAMGMLLYLLLADELPYRLAGTTAVEQHQLVCEREPPLPSTQATEPARAAQLRGDLDLIVLAALRKEPARRYASVEALASDLRRWQQGLPITARPDTFGYRAQRFVRRNRMAVAAGALLILSLAGGLAASLWQAREAEAARALAEQRYRDVRNLASGLITDVDASLMRVAGATQARQQLVERAVSLLDRLSSEAEGDAELLLELGAGFERIADILGSPYEANLGNTQAALTHARRALQVRTAAAAIMGHDAASSTALARSELQVAGIQELVTSSGDAIFSLVPGALARLEAHLDSTPPDGALALLASRAINLLGDAHMTRSEFAEAAALQQRAMALIDSARSNGSSLDADWRRALGITQVKLAIAWWWAEEPVEPVLHMLRAGVAELEALLEEQPNDARAMRVVAATNSMLANVLMFEESNIDGQPYLERAIQIGERLLELDPLNRQSRIDLAGWRLEVAKFFETGLVWEEADQQAEIAVALLEGLYADDPTSRALGARLMQTRCIRGRLLMAGRAAGLDEGRFSTQSVCGHVQSCVALIDEYPDQMLAAWSDTEAVPRLRDYAQTCAGP